MSPCSVSSTHATISIKVKKTAIDFRVLAHIDIMAFRSGIPTYLMSGTHSTLFFFIQPSGLNIKKKKKQLSSSRDRRTVIDCSFFRMAVRQKLDRLLYTWAKCRPVSVELVDKGGYSPVCTSLSFSQTLLKPNPAKIQLIPAVQFYTAILSAVSSLSSSNFASVRTRTAMANYWPNSLSQSRWA